MSRFKVASIFSSSMVLQRDKDIAVFGDAINGTTVTATINYVVNGEAKEEKASVLAENERFLLYLPAISYADECTLTVTDGTNTTVFDDIVFGEVWILGGQSNMEFELQNCIGGAEHLENDNPNVRFYYTQKKGFMDEDFFRTEDMMIWKKFDKESSKCWSAVGYLFGKELSEKLGVPVGLIGCNWGGTSASAWMDVDSIVSSDITRSYWDEYVERNAGKSVEEQIKEYDDYVVYEAVWNDKCNKCYAENPGISWDEVQKLIGTCEWPGPINIKNPFRPAGLYECMLKRVMPVALRGALWYQGESDDHKPAAYYTLFSNMIAKWRADWSEPELPFIFVQLPGHRYSGDPDYKHWCLIREAQAEVSKTVNNTAMAVCIDQGEFNEIHPKNKDFVANRLCRQALLNVYGIGSENEANSPCFESVSFENGKAIVSFSFVDSELKIKGDKINGFELAGEDKVFSEATATLAGEKVVVTAENVPDPKYVRYLWTNYPNEVNLFSAYDLPVAPFRSDKNDDAAMEKHETVIKQIMEL